MTPRVLIQTPAQAQWAIFLREAKGEPTRPDAIAWLEFGAGDRYERYLIIQNWLVSNWIEMTTDEADEEGKRDDQANANLAAELLWLASEDGGRATGPEAIISCDTCGGPIPESRIEVSPDGLETSCRGCNQLARLQAALPSLKTEMAEATEPIRLLISRACPEVRDGSDEYHALIDLLEQQDWWIGDGQEDQ